MMVELRQPPAMAPVALAELRAFLRIDGFADEAELAAQLRAATDLCEAYLGLPLLHRQLRETLAARYGWQRLSIAPVVAIELVEVLNSDGSAHPIALDHHGIDIDGAGQGWVRGTPLGTGQRLRVTYCCGSAADWNGIAEAIRHGILRMAAHLRMDGDGAPPAAVVALWRPYRVLRLGSAAVGGGR